MARCKANTTRGTRCKRDAVHAQEYCSIHTVADAGQDDAPEPREDDWGDLLLGMVAAGAAFWVIQKAHRWLPWPRARL